MWLSQVRRVFGDDKVCGATQSMHKAQCWESTATTTYE